MVLSITTLGYWIFYLKLPGHAFCTTIGSIVAVAIVWGYRALPRRFHIRRFYIVLATAIGYPLFGFYSLLATALIALTALFREKRQWMDSGLAVFLIFLLPIIGYHFFFHETNIVNIYWSALPVFVHQGERFFAYNIPYIVLFASMALMALSPNLNSTRLTNGAIALVVAVCLCIFWNRDENLHGELGMKHSIEESDWNRALTTAKNIKGEPTRLICMMRNLALYEQGADDNKGYPEGAKRPDAPFTVHTVHTAGKLLYLQYGIPNYCYRWCMEDGVEYGWSVEKFKLMAMCSILNNEPVVAQRFVNLLKKTTFHKQWALRFETYIHNPHQANSAPELKHILPLLRSDNFLTADQSQQELFLIEQILSTQGATQEQRRLAAFTMNYYRNNRHKLVEQ